MIRADQLQIGDYVLVSGTLRRVESITKKKIGYHINPQTDKRLYYARLHDVEPISISSIKRKEYGFLVNEEIQIEAEVSVLDLSIDSLCYFSNILGESLILRSYYVHSLQHIVRMLCPKRTIKL